MMRGPSICARSRSSGCGRSRRRGLPTCATTGAAVSPSTSARCSRPSTPHRRSAAGS
ncbi:hypothetical protein BKA18_002171 [Streptomyces auratus]